MKGMMGTLDLTLGNHTDDVRSCRPFTRVYLQQEKHHQVARGTLVHLTHGGL